MSNQEDRFDFSDSENHGNQGERYRKSSEDKNDNGKADGINWGGKDFFHDTGICRIYGFCRIES